MHDVLEIDRVGGKGRPEEGMFEPAMKDGKALGRVNGGGSRCGGV